MKLQFRLSTLLIITIVAGVVLGLVIRLGIPIEVIATGVGFLIAAVGLGVFLKFSAPNARDGVVAIIFVALVILANIHFERVSTGTGYTKGGSPPFSYSFRIITIGLPLGFYEYDATHHTGGYGIQIMPLTIDVLVMFAAVSLALFLDRRLRRWSQAREPADTAPTG